MESEYRKGYVYIQNHFSGIIAETEEGYIFTYDQDYLDREDAVAVSLTLPLRQEPYEPTILFPFFDGLIPEGWLLYRPAPAAHRPDCRGPEPQPLRRRRELLQEVHDGCIHDFLCQKAGCPGEAILHYGDGYHHWKDYPVVWLRRLYRTQRCP